LLAFRKGLLLLKREEGGISGNASSKNDLLWKADPWKLKIPATGN
jgi:hypothetical protein